MDLPVNVETGMVVGRYIVDVIDGVDANRDPDAQPVQGRIVFTSSVPYLPNPTAAPDPVTILRVPIVGVLDQDGYLCTPYPGTLEPQYRGVHLIATDDPDIAVTDWTWDVTYIFEPVDGHKLAIPAHGFALPSGGVVDLTKVAKVPSSPGYSLPQAEAAVLRAEEAALAGAADSLAARQAADRAEQAAAATDEGITSMLSDPDTQSGGLLADQLALKANADDVELSLSGKADTQSVDAALRDKADASALDAKADLENGKVPDAQTPAGVTSSLNGKVSKGDLYTNVKDYGAVGDGIADDTEAINAAANAAYAKSQNSELFIPPGVYRISDTVIIQTGLMASQAEIRYYGTGTAVQLGSGVSGANLTRKTIRLPRVRQYTNSYNPTSHDGTSVGVMAINLISCDLYVPFIQHFEDGLVMHGLGAGNGYNTVYLQSLWGNHRNLVISRDTNGWSNQNLYLGGRISPASWYDGDAAGSYISIDGNQNTFIGVSLEGAGEYLHRIKFLTARYNTFISPRLEATAWAGKPGILWGSGSYYNRIEGGYNTVNVDETFEAGVGANTIQHAEGAIEFRSNRADALSVPPSTVTAINTWGGVNGFRYSYDAVTGVFTPRQGRWQINATVGLSSTASGGYVNVRITRTDGATLAVKRFIPGVNVLTSIEVSARSNFAAGQGFRVEIFHTNPEPLIISTTVEYCKLQAEYLGW